MNTDINIFELVFEILASIGTIAAILISYISLKRSDRNFMYQTRRELYEKRNEFLELYINLNEFKFKLLDFLNEQIKIEDDEFSESKIDEFAISLLKEYEPHYHLLKEFLNKNVGLFDIISEQYVMNLVSFYESIALQNFDKLIDYITDLKYAQYLMTNNLFVLYIRNNLRVSFHDSTNRYQIRRHKKVVHYIKSIIKTIIKMDNYKIKDENCEKQIKQILEENNIESKDNLTPPLRKKIKRIVNTHNYIIKCQPKLDKKFDKQFKLLSKFDDLVSLPESDLIRKII